MVLQTTGPIAMQNIQEEFGGTNPINLSEYYVGGVYVPSHSGTSTIPTSSTIALSNFYGTTRGSPVNEIVGAFFNNEIAVRNYLTSKESISYGFETNTETDLTYGISTPTNRYSTSVDVTCTFGTVPSAFSSIISDYITVVTINTGPGDSSTLLQDLLYINGIDYSTSYVSHVTKFFADTVGMVVKVYHIQEHIENITSLRSRFKKISQDILNKQEFFVIPGKWDVIYNDYLYHDTSLVMPVVEDDIIIAHSIISGHNYYPITATGVTANLLMDRRVMWYNGSTVQYEIITQTGNRYYYWPIKEETFYPGGDDTWNPYTVYTYSNSGVLQLRYNRS